MHSVWSYVSQKVWVRFIDHTKLAQGWVIIRENFDPVMGIQMAKSRGWVLSYKTTVNPRD